MNDAIYALTLRSMNADVERLSSVASNLANVSTTGYKRQIPVFESFQKMIDTQEFVAPQISIDNRAGTMRVTNQALDLAIIGDGFFQVQSENGIAYTRNGSFSIDSRGRLVTPQGWPVMGRDGEIQLAGRSPVIDTQGFVREVSADGVSRPPVAQLKLVKFENSKEMRPLGLGLFGMPEGAGLSIDSQAQIKQGALENSNVSSSKEMVDLIQIMRHFESTQKVIQGYDEMMGLAIKKLTE